MNTGRDDTGGGPSGVTSQASLSRSTALITGATSGIGRALALVLSGRGVRIIAHGRDTDRMQSLCEQANGAVCDTVLAELGDEEGRKRVESSMQRYEPNVLVLNAGSNDGKKLASEWTDDDASRSLTVNLLAPILLARTFARLPRTPEPRRLVFVLSTSCLFPRPQMGLYVAAKSGLMGFGKVMQQELHELGVQTLLVYPGRTDTTFRADGQPNYMRPGSVAEAIADILSLPNDLVPYEFVFRPSVDTRI